MGASFEMWLILLKEIILLKKEFDTVVKHGPGGCYKSWTAEQQTLSQYLCGCSDEGRTLSSNQRTWFHVASSRRVLSMTRLSVRNTRLPSPPLMLQPLGLQDVSFLSVNSAERSNVKYLVSITTTSPMTSIQLTSGLFGKLRHSAEEEKGLLCGR